MNTRHICIFLLALAATATAQNRLVITKAGSSIDFEGNKGTLPSTIVAAESLNGIDKITFDNDEMLIHHGADAVSYNIKEIDRVSLSGNINKCPIFYPPSISQLLNFEPATDAALDSSYAEGRYVVPFKAEATVDIHFAGNDIECNTADGVTLSDGTLLLEPASRTTYRLSGHCEGVKIQLRATNEALFLLDNLQAVNNDGPSVFIDNANQTIITTAPKSLNTLSGISSTGNGALTLCGEGNLQIVSSCDHCAAIRAASDINIAGGTLNIACSGYCGQGVYSDTNVNISRGAINILTTGDGTQEDDKLGFDCSAAVCAGIANTKTNGNINITGGKIRIKTTGGTGAAGLAAMHHIKATNATIILATFDDGFNAVDGIETNNCNIFSTSAVDDAVDSNGALIFRGGVLYACGPYPKEGAFDNDGKNFAIENDITLIALGAKTDKPMASKSTVPVLSLKDARFKKYVSIRDAAGTEILSFITPSYPGKAALAVASPRLTPNTTYEIYTSDQCISGLEVWGVIKDATFGTLEKVASATASTTK